MESPVISYIKNTILKRRSIDEFTTYLCLTAEITLMMLLFNNMINIKIFLIDLAIIFVALIVVLWIRLTRDGYSYYKKFKYKETGDAKSKEIDVAKYLKLLDERLTVIEKTTSLHMTLYAIFLAVVLAIVLPLILKLLM